MIGILGAMVAEVEQIGGLLENPGTTDVDGSKYATGRLGSHDAVVGISGFGKVAAASTVTTMLDRFGSQMIVFTGVAGALHTTVQRGDVVLATELLQHDFDASPIVPRFVIPSLQVDRIAADEALTDRCAEAALAAGATVHRGLVISGDQFIDTVFAKANLQSYFPDALAVEMEGAAVAQVCAQRQVPFAVVRAVSDSADEDAAVDFLEFVDEEAAPMLAAIVSGMV